MHYPAEEGYPRAEKMTEFARRLGESISMRVGAAQHEDGWYVHMPDGASRRIATFQEMSAEHPPQNLYLVYNSNGTVDLGRAVFGVEFQMERADPLRGNKKQETTEEYHISADR